MKAIIVEDEMTVARDLSETLGEIGYTVPAIARRADEALEAISRHRPDLVLIDIMLRGEKDGIDLARTLRATHRVPFLFITAHADRATVGRATSTQPAGYLVKPFSKDDVYVATEMALNNYAEEPRDEEPIEASPKAVGRVEKEAEPEDGKGLSAYRLQKVKEHVEVHLDEDLTVAQMAEVAGMSRSHFTRLFKQSTGETPYHYVMERRIVEGKRLLKRTTLSIAQIALRVGFGSQSHFSKAFSQHVGVSPSAYRARR